MLKVASLFSQILGEISRISPYRLAGYKVVPLSLEGAVVLLEYGRHAPSESLYLQGSAGLARRTLCDAALDT